MKFDNLFKLLVERDELESGESIVQPDETITSDSKEEQTEQVSNLTNAELTKKLQYLLSGKNNKGATFVSFIYSTKTTGDTAKYLVDLNVDYDRAKKEDRAKVEQYEPKNELEAHAKVDILGPSYTPKNEMEAKALEIVKAKKPRKYTNPYTNLGHGLRVKTAEPNAGVNYIWGFVKNKTVEIPTKREKKEVKSSELTITKNRIKQELELKTLEFGNFILLPAHIGLLKLKNNTIEFHIDEEPPTI